MKSIIKSMLSNSLWRYIAIKRRLPWGPYKHMSSRDRNSFASMLSIWRPSNTLPVILLEWNMTRWCNYNCSYCNQPHQRFARNGKYTAHAFDNFPLEDWLSAFARHFEKRRLALLISGGEPMMDKKNMLPFLQELTAMPTVEYINISTNASWNPKMYEGLDLSKITLLLSYHPTQIVQESFFNRLDELLEFGFKIGMVNFVMSKDNFAQYSDFKTQIAKKGVPSHSSPQWQLRGKYSKEELAILKQELPEMDYSYRTGVASTFGKKCLFPAVSYQMDQTGHILVSCHPQVTGSFFDQSLPSVFAGPVPCPHISCGCLHKYSLLKGSNRDTNVNILQIYSNILKQKQGINS